MGEPGRSASQPLGSILGMKNIRCGHPRAQSYARHRLTRDEMEQQQQSKKCATLNSVSRGTSPIIGMFNHVLITQAAKRFCATKVKLAKQDRKQSPPFWRLLVFWIAPIPTLRRISCLRNQAPTTRTKLQRNPLPPDRPRTPGIWHSH